MKVRPNLKRILKDERGFSLPELLVTMLMMLTVMFALYSIFDMSLRVFSYGNDKIEAVENARLGLERMEREIRAAYPQDDSPDSENSELLTTTQPGRISFGNDFNGECGLNLSGDGGCQAEKDARESIEYYVNQNGTLIRLNNNQYSPVVENVEEEGLEFHYCQSVCESDDLPDTAPSEEDIEMVRITLDVRVEEGTQTLTTDVALRNRG